MAADPAEAELVGPNGWKSTLDIRQLRAFLAIAADGSVSAAAVTLGLAQSTVSEALAALDQALGTPTVLRRRGAHRTMLTDAGRALLPHARRVLQEIDSAHHAIATVTRGASASVTLTANESVSTYLLTSALGDLRSRWPNTRFSVSVATCANVRADVAEGRCDMGLLLENDATPTSGKPDLRATHRKNSDGIIAVTGGTPLVIFSGPTHSLVRRERRGALPLDSVAPFRMFVADAAGDFHELLAQYFAADGLPGPRLEPVGSIDAVKRGVHADPSALGILPRYALTEDLESGRMRALRLDPAPPCVRLVALLPRTHAERHPSVSELLALLRSA